MDIRKSYAKSDQYAAQRNAPSLILVPFEPGPFSHDSSLAPFPGPFPMAADFDARKPPLWVFVVLACLLPAWPLGMYWFNNSYSGGIDWRRCMLPMTATCRDRKAQHP